MFEDSNETGHSFGVLLNLLQPNIKSIARKIEKAQLKWVSCSYGVTFLNTCISENLLPKFTDIYIYI